METLQSATAIAPATMVLILINVIVFILESVAGGSLNTDVAERFGAMTVYDLENKQWWRLFSSMFMHFGLFHLLCNMTALYSFGVMIEQLFGVLGGGAWRGSVFILVAYLVSGVCGNLLSWKMMKKHGEYYVQSAGASGAICGLLGAYVGLIFFPGMATLIIADWQSVLINIALCIVPGLAVKQINMWAHLGGLIGGFIVSILFTIIRFLPVLI